MDIENINKNQCRILLNLNGEPIERFKARIMELGRTAEDTVIVLFNVDDANGGELADWAMPGYDWQQFRDKGMVPVARGLQDRKTMEGILDLFDAEAAEKLRASTELSVVVVDFGVAEIFTA